MMDSRASIRIRVVEAMVLADSKAEVVFNPQTICQVKRFAVTCGYAPESMRLYSVEVGGAEMLGAAAHVGVPSTLFERLYEVEYPTISPTQIVVFRFANRALAMQMVTVTIECAEIE